MHCLNKLSLATLQAYRAQTFRTHPGRRLASRDEAVAFVRERGFIYFWPITGILLPSLWVAAAGDRPVADAHDDPGHVTWGWKDSLLGSDAWYYAKVLRKKATIIAPDLAPSFYALSENYGAPDEDYLTQYEQGRMTLESRTVYETILDEGPLDTPALRRATRMTSRESDGRFNKAITDLQAEFRIVPVRVAQVGAWNYAFVYDAVHRVYPELLEKARFIGEVDARLTLAECYFRSLGAAQLRDVNKLFGWKPAESAAVAEKLIQRKFLQGGVSLENQTGEWLALAALVA
ncbi:MAG: AlkZ-related protein [Chloroflexota bacterium]